MFELSNSKAAKPTLPRSGLALTELLQSEICEGGYYARIQYNARPRNLLEGGAIRVKARVGVGGFRFLG